MSRRRKAAKAADVIAAAREWLGTPYHDQASVRGVGCDCLGLARGVWRDVVGAEPRKIPPYTRDWGEVSQREVMKDEALAWMIPVDPAKAKPGDMLVFRMKHGAIAKHCGILVAPDRFIHSYDRLGVVEQPMTEAWRRKVAFAFRYPKEAP